MSTIIYIALWLFLSLCHIILGKQIASMLKSSSAKLGYSVHYILGLQIHLLVCFFLKFVGLPWVVALCTPLILCLSNPKEFKILLSAIRINPTINLICWVAITLVTGISLIDGNNGLGTIWRNNYGDSAIHFSIITSFVFGNNFPPEYPVLAGAPLSYPFLYDFWTAALWWLTADFRDLPILFILQWFNVWLAIYYILDGDRNRIFPWMLLFGGGAIKYAHWWQNAGDLIGEGKYWTTFISTIWVPQRASILGIATTLSALKIVQVFYIQTSNRRDLLLAGLILSLSLLIHTHFFLVAVIFILSWLIFRILLNNWNKVTDYCYDLLHFGVGLFPSLALAPLIMQKRSLVKIDPDFLQKWWPNLMSPSTGLAGWIILAVMLLAFAKRYCELLAMALLFIIGLYLKTSNWDWDQIKIFIGIYIVFVSLWAHLRDPLSNYARYLGIILIVPGFISLVQPFKNFTVNNIYSPEVIKQADAIRTATPENAIILAAHDHNSVITLTGRKMYFGYPGWMWSHGLSDISDARIALSKPLSKILDCPKQAQHPCPDFLWWGPAEKNFFELQEPGPGFQSTAVPGLYKPIYNSQ